MLVFIITMVSTSIVALTQLVHIHKIGICVYLPIYALIQGLVYFIGLYSCYYYSFPPGSAMVISAETARISMKVHAYFREKMLNGVNKDSHWAKFIPDWAAKVGVTEKDLDLPNITIEGKNICDVITF